ncbi:MAG TPA: lysophospholipid acyltransferase family protein [Myxococcota bacterium]|nr:lysophospholipid acyltransferase family protein [Myxococcota bacterium]
MSRFGQTGEAMERAHRGQAAAVGAERVLAHALRCRLRRTTRQAATALVFGVAGCSALLLAFTVLPLCRLLPDTREARDARAQRIIHHGYGLLLGFMSLLGLTQIRYEGFERLRTPGAHLVVANHPSLIDFGIVIAQLPQVDCIVAEAWARSFWLGRVARAAGYVVNSRGAAAVDECVVRLRAGRTVLLFPEGTRSPQAGLWPFRRGAAHVALRSGCDVELVTIHLDPPVLMKGQPWWDVPDRRVEYFARVEPPVRVKDRAWEGKSDVLAARRITAAVRTRMIEGLNRGPVR